MRMSEAMRLGAMLKGQCRGTLLKWTASLTESGLVQVTCAMGAAFDASGVSKSDLRNGELRDLTTRFWPWAVDWPVPDELLPAHSRITAAARFRVWDVVDVVTYLNDCAYWTREAIADWVETVEDYREQAQTIQGEGEARREQTEADQRIPVPA